MKKLFLLLLVVTIPLMGCPKKPINGEMTKKVSGLQIEGIDANFKNLFIDVAMEIDRCTLEPTYCENLPDPWKDDKRQTLPQQIETVRQDTNSGKVQVTMAWFEHAMLNEKGGPQLTKSNVYTIFAYHAGYGLENIAKRMNKYIDLLSQ